MPLVPSSLIPKNPSGQLQAVLKWAEAMSTADFDVLDTVVADNFVHAAIPANLKIPVLNGKQEFIQHYRAVLPMFTKFEVRVLSTSFELS